MISKKFLKTFLIGSFMIMLVVSEVFCQTTVRAPTNEQLDELLDTIFPKSSGRFDGNTCEYSIDVRVNPSFAAPMQISITKFTNGKIQAQKFRFADPSKPIFEQLIILDNYGKTVEFKELGKELKIERIEIRQKKLLQTLVSKFFGFNKINKKQGLNFDGDAFEIWYVDSLSKLYFFQMGSQRYEKKESTLITLIREIFQKVN